MARSISSADWMGCRHAGRTAAGWRLRLALPALAWLASCCGNPQQPRMRQIAIPLGCVSPECLDVVDPNRDRLTWEIQSTTRSPVILQFPKGVLESDDSQGRLIIEAGSSVRTLALSSPVKPAYVQAWTEEGEAELGFSVVQRLGSSLIDEFHSQDCGPIEEAVHRVFGDTLRLTAASQIEDVLIIADGRNESGDCVDDAIYRMTEPAGTLRLKLDLEDDFTCQGRLWVFSKSHAAVQYEKRIPRPASDSICLRLSPPVPIQIALWLLFGDPENAVATIAKANQVFSDQRVGVVLHAGLVDLRSDPMAEALRSSGEAQSNGLCEEAWRSPFYDETKINVYFRDGDNPHYCGFGSDIIKLASDSQVETLLHELGHALGLPEANSSFGTSYDQSNLMWLGADGRDHFKLGQVFRMNFHHESALFRRELVGAGGGQLPRDPMCCPWESWGNQCPVPWLELGGE